MKRQTRDEWVPKAFAVRTSAFVRRIWRHEEVLAAGGDEAKRAFVAMMGMKKIDVAAIKAARRG